MNAHLEEVTASDIMQRNVVRVLPGDSLREASEMLFEHNVSAMPVIDSNGNCLGILSLTDLVEFARRATPGSPLARLRGRTLSNTSVSELMTTRVVSVRENTSLTGVRQTLKRLGLNHVPVVNDDGRLTGVISSSDIERFATLRPSVSTA